MEILLSRILRYLNGALENNSHFKAAGFIVSHYLQIRDYTIERMSEESGLSVDEILAFINLFGLHTFEEFLYRVDIDYELRLSQIGLRMVDTTERDFLSNITTDCEADEFLEKIRSECEQMFKAKRIVIFGSHYPSAVAVDFQTDMITFGKEVIDYHRFVNDFKFREDDFTLVISATGRTLEDLDQNMIDQGICNTHILLVTQNPRLANYNDVCADEVILIKGRYDGMQFNHQLMSVFDTFRIVYFKQFYRN